ncbi:MAG TPA: NUDIX hydrolase [Mycobacteriales bacterium]
MEAVFVVVVIAALLGVWVGWTSERVQRLHARTTSARASLDAQLVRRAAALQAIAERSTDTLGPQLAARLRGLAAASLDADPSTRESAENDLSRALYDIPPEVDEALLGDLADAARRVAFARRFYNDAVRDTVALRRGRLPRLFRLGGRQPLPAFFEIDDTAPKLLRPTPAAGGGT